jgi:hypothetical protein
MLSLQIHRSFGGKKAMKLTNYLASVGIAVMLGSAAPFAWCQVTEPDASNGTASIAPAAASPTAPPEKIAPTVSVSAADAEKSAKTDIKKSADAPVDQAVPGASKADMVNAQYVQTKIAQAQKQGMDVSAAQMQEAMGKAAMKKGMNDEAAEHFETALSAIGEMPSARGDN